MLTIHRAQRSTVLADALARLLADPLPDPFATEVVAVPAKGVERWLTQRLSHVLGAVDGDGVAANIAFPSPTRVVDEAIAAAAGSAPDDDPWAPPRLLWTVLSTIDGCLDEPWCAVLRAHLYGEHRITRRWATAAHLGDLWRSYAAQRPQLFVDWAAGHDTDGLGEPLPRDLCWQAELWRRVRERLAVPSPAERLADACDALRDDPARSALPPRLSLFGATRLTTEQLAVLHALAAHRDVHVWLPHPSPAMWAALADRPTAVRRRADDSALWVRHPLLASLARDTRELQQRLAPLADADRGHDEARTPTTLLQHLQAAIAADRPPEESAVRDGSVQVHACHGPPRQVEVLREVLLHLFTADPTLEPRDVLVMCPDVEAYAPLVRAAFGQGETAEHPGHRLRVRLADRALRRTNPVLDTVVSLLDLADGRVTASQVLDLAAQEPVRRRFGFADDDLERLQTWAGASGVRWGIRTAQRQAFGLAAVPQNTWTTGLDRLLVGVAADETELGWLGTALPLDDVASGDIDLVGRLAELVDRLEAVLYRLRGPHPATSWREHLGLAVDLFCEVAPSEAWHLAEARRELAAALDHAEDIELRLADIRAMLAGRLGGRPTRANFRTGELTVATLVPMRSVPHRVVILLGLDDEVFPRGAGVDGDDVLARDPALGERDRRSEDRQLLLDAVMSAQEKLVVLYTGADPVSGQVRPPAVPLGELLDVLALTAGTDDVVRRHRLQPFDPDDFRRDEPFSHDRTALAGARAARGPRTPAPDLLPHPLPPPDGDVELTDLVAFAVHPVQAFLRQRLGVRLPEEEDEVADALSADLEPLDRWDVGDRMLAARLRGVPAADWRRAEWRRGTLPPKRLGHDLLAEVETAVEAIVAAAIELYAQPATTYDVAVDLGAGRRLTGSVPGVRDGVLVGTSYSRLAGKHRLTAWVRLLALAATYPDGTWHAMTTGRWRQAGAQRSLLAPPADPRAVLADLIALRDEGLCTPLPLPPQAAAEYADRRHRGDEVADALAGAESAYGGKYGDQLDRHLAYVYGASGWSAVTAAAPGGGESTRFGELSRRLWDPLLTVERQQRL